MRMSRRGFMKGVAAGTAVAVVPGLTGCGASAAIAPAATKVLKLTVTSVAHGLGWDIVGRPALHAAHGVLRRAHERLQAAKPGVPARDWIYSHAQPLDDELGLSAIVGANFGGDDNQLTSHTAVVCAEGIETVPAVVMLAIARLVERGLKEGLDGIPEEQRERRTRQVRRKLRKDFGIRDWRITSGSEALHETSTHLVLTTANRHIEVTWSPTLDPLLLGELAVRRGRVFDGGLEPRWLPGSRLRWPLAYDEIWGEP